MAKETVIKTAEFNPRVRNYWLVSVTIVLMLTIIGIPFLLIWWPLGLLFTGKYLARMECHLTTRDLKVKKGILTRVEKTVPLEKITDLGLIQGPIMRHFGVHQLNIETAGQSGTGALLSLTGIIDVEAFREAVLNQRDRIQDIPGDSPAVAAPATTQTDANLLVEIRDALHRIEVLLQKRQD